MAQELLEPLTEQDMEQYIGKAAVLSEALPYIQRFRNKIVVIKYGGSTMEEDRSMASVLKDVVLMECVGMHPIIVHGGGNLISKRLQERHLEPHFVEGLRVTDQETMEVVEEVLMEVNLGIVDEIKKYGGEAQGLSGKTDELIYCKKKKIPSGDLGFVGEVTHVSVNKIMELCKKNVVPVIAPIGLGEDKHAYNLNADTAAGEIAAALRAEKLVYLTNVEGILKDKRDSHSLLSTLHINEIERLIDTKVIEGGMIPKVRSGLRSVKAGVAKTHIIDGRIQHSLLLEIFTDKGVGTEIIK